MRRRRGNPNLAAVRNKDRTAANAERQRRAREFAHKMKEILIDAGVGPEECVAWLNANGYLTRTGRKWTRFSLRNLFVRIKKTSVPRKRRG
jgi:hypothetical protein